VELPVINESEAFSSRASLDREFESLLQQAVLFLGNRVTKRGRILVADGHEMMREAVRGILESRDDLEVCGEAADGKECIRKTRELKPDLVILDLSMPVIDGLETARIIRKFFPRIRILIFSVHQKSAFVEEAKAIGVAGVVNKLEKSQVLLRAVDAVLQDQTFFPGALKFD
jgi:two-component system, NarL family, nitrate/nitrite response regulator NarL